MEPDEIQKLYQTTYITSTSSGGYTFRDVYDLSHVSTRDLLNECYRRRAIEKFSFTDSIDQDYLMMNPDAKEYITHDAMRCLWKSIYKDQKFLQDALMIREKSDIAYRRVNITGEIYVCKHPTKVRK